MQSEIAERLKLRHSPVAIVFSDEKPTGAIQFQEGKWGCVAAMVVAAAKGRTAVFDRKTYGCLGGGVGLGFGNLYPHFPGGFENFLSTGAGEGYPPGEAYKKNPELVKTFVDELPMTDIPYQYVVCKPLGAVDPAKEEPKLVVFLATADQLSALVVLANYGRPGMNNVIIPFAAGCQAACIIPLNEASQEHPKAVVGMVDISARPVIDADLLSFSVPFNMYQEMEGNVPGSFLDKHDWTKVAARIPEVD